ncbi:ThiF family adenylyltransferase [Wohlfahrtiimonas sp. G9077]|uniref:ThiF family adenylyltransferase n=1 Tax=Wohlfahrtiimonas sp. G9077 TaxID=1980118 RepID=UPI000B9987F3|nr:ThiF family adenylyltransferase [Wohlfahrtiimonas sp. G9077]OYQ72876.1 thiamine biosynthesis protein ThiF [Wohlfahrtiimonas sp. G9077]
MNFTESELKEVIGQISFVRGLSELSFSEASVKFQIYFDFKPLVEPILFNVEISPCYPLKFANIESIRFKNSELIQFSHVMSDGSICFHNNHCTNFKEKLQQDFLAIQNWIIKYILNEDKDQHYEHLIVSHGKFDSILYSYQFTNINKKFEKNEFGEVLLKFISQSPYGENKVNNFMVKEIGGVSCDWSAYYINQPYDTAGIYLFIESPPVINGRFSFDNWEQFKEILNQDFLSYLWKYIFANSGKYNQARPLPLFLGFYTQNHEIHWQVALLNIDQLFFQLSPTNSIYTIQNETICWAITENSSYEYFFGRGSFNKKLTNSNILIIGIGAVGSQVAKVLTKCGCKKLTLIDYDIKKPENICRSEYAFSHPFTNKIDELTDILLQSSPFIDIKFFKKIITEHIKYSSLDEWYKNQIHDDLTNFDYIFDCSTDDDLMYILDQLGSPTILNLSITNHANSLVCGVSPILYKFVQHQFNKILDNDMSDLYNPTGCWSPTFKASYNDIATLVQFALKHINTMIERDTLGNFIIQYSDEMQTMKVEKF